MVKSSILDMRHIENGWKIPSEGYCDQPYIVKTDDNAWLCTMTTGIGVESEGGQHVISMRSTDCGKTWETPVDVEPADGPEASYSVLLKSPSSRIFVFYNHNTDNIRRVKVIDDSSLDGYNYRVDSLGHFVFKYSDDHGRSWSEKRYDIPQRLFEIDRENIYGGKLLFFWNVGKAFTHNGKGYVPLHKVGNFGQGFFVRNEGILLVSENILTENDPEKITWETYPDGDVGLRTPPGGGTIAGEQSFSVLSDGSIYVVYRTIDGHPVFSYSRDNGHTFNTPQYKRYSDGRLVKHPRAANFAWKCENGKYLYWYHNHGGHWYQDRNPAWLLGGIEMDGPEGKVIQWSQPEIMLYTDDADERMSYPDLVEQDGKLYITETQKKIARTHLIDPKLITAVWGQFEKVNSIVEDGKLFEWQGIAPVVVSMLAIPDFREIRESQKSLGETNLRVGFSLDIWVKFDSMEGGQILLDNRKENGDGWMLITTNSKTLKLVINDGYRETCWDCDEDMLQVGQRHHVGIVVDGGPCIISYVIDGKFNDGGEHRQFGFGRFSQYLRKAKGADELRIAPLLNGKLGIVRIYNRALLTSEIIQNYRFENGKQKRFKGLYPQGQ